MIASSKLCCNLFHLKRSICNICALCIVRYCQWNLATGKYGILHDTIEHASMWVCLLVCVMCVCLSSVLSPIVTCFDFAYECIHCHAYILTLFSQKLLNRTQHPIAILRHEIQFLVFTGERLSQYHINIYWYFSMLILTLCCLILMNSDFISVCQHASEMQLYSMFFEFWIHQYWWDQI